MDRQSVFDGFAQRLNLLIDDTGLSCSVDRTNSVVTVLLKSFAKENPNYETAAESIFVALKNQFLTGIKLVQFHGQANDGRIVWSKALQYPYIPSPQEKANTALLGCGFLMVIIFAGIAGMSSLMAIGDAISDQGETNTVAAYLEANHQKSYLEACDTEAIQRQFKAVAGDTIDNETEIKIAVGIIEANCNF